MKRLIAFCTAAALVLGCQAVSAGGKRDHGRHYRGHDYSHPRHGHRRPHGYGHGRRHHRSYGAEYLVGGLLLGSILTDTYYRRAQPDVYYIERRSYPPPRVVYRETTVVGPAPIRRHLLRDLEGNCYQRTFDRSGNELRTELPAPECDW